MESYILKENVLTDDVLYIADSNKLFKGGYIAAIVYYTYLNEWSDKRNYKHFKSIDTLKKYLSKNYPNFLSDIEL